MTSPWTTITKPVTGATVSKSAQGDPIVDDLNYLKTLAPVCVQLQLNGATALTTSDKAYFRGADKMTGTWTLTKVSAMCKGASSSGAVTLTVKNGSTSMLSTNITLDQNEYDTLTAATPAVISTPNVVTGDQIEVAVTGAGVGVTFCIAELTFTPPTTV
jgi:hypothetical protein